MPKISTYPLSTPTAAGDEVLGLRNGAVVRFPANDADALVVAAEAAKTAAELARDLSQAASAASVIALAAKDTIAIGRGLVADGATFWVKPNATDGLTRYTNYLRTSSTTQTFIVDQITGSEYDGRFVALPMETGYLGARVDTVGRAIELIELDGTIAPQKIKLPAASVTRSMLGADEQTGLVATGIGIMFEVLPIETGYVEVLVDLNGRMVRGVPAAGPVEMVVTRALKADNGAGHGARDNPAYVTASFTDGTGKRQLRSIRKSDGKVFTLTSSGNNTDPFLTASNKILYNSDATGVDVQRWIAAEGGASGLLMPRKQIYTWGDSTSQNTFQTALASATGLPVSVQGISSQTSGEITARQGGKPALLTVSGNSIPASGAVTVTAWSEDFLASKNTPTDTRAATGTLAGVAGTLTKTGSPSTYSFTRTAAGSVTPCPAATPFVTDIGVEGRDAISILWMGTNDVIYGGSAAGLQTNVNAAVAYNSCYAPQQLVIGPFNRSNQAVGGAQYQMVLDMEASLAANAAVNGYAFYNLRRYLIDSRAVVAAALGITLTAQDAIDASNDMLPTSFRTDTTHLTPTVSTYLGNTILVNQLTGLGWI